MHLDLDAIARAAAEQVAAKILEQLPTIVRAELERREQSEMLDARALSRLLGCSTAALAKRLARGSQLAAIAVQLDGKRVWMRRDVESLIARK